MLGRGKKETQATVETEKHGRSSFENIKASNGSGLPLELIGTQRSLVTQKSEERNNRAVLMWSMLEINFKLYI